jgi:predicted nucleic acid-binding protein
VASSEGVPEFVLDSWPVMEWLKKRQPASDRFRTLIEQALEVSLALVMSRINYGEVVYSIAKDLPLRKDEALRAFSEIPIQFVSVDDRLIDEAVALKAVYRISYADAFAAALGLRLGIPVVTGDPEFFNLRQVGVQLQWLGA